MKRGQKTGTGSDTSTPSESPKTIEVRPGIYQFRSEKPGSHIYLIRGESKNVLIDTGTTNHFPLLKSRFSDVGLRIRDIHLLLLTHEHFDHIGATSFFHRTAVVAAHRLAANKLELQDDFVTLNKYYNVPSRAFWVDVWLEDGAVIDLGNRRLLVVHTPGHTSGCVCYYEPDEGLLFSGDTVFAGGTLSDIAGSGSVSDYVESVQRLNNLKVKEIIPGHGKSSNTPDEDLPKAVENAQNLLNDSMVFFEAFIKTRELQGRGGYWQERPRSK
ncbi:MAG: MBL fold metallo-hydrolase [Dehalococcoidales bacterium]|nr:MAG: MBL fold metallo-hydrolase [Dehalococcoidales bacterium]